MITAFFKANPVLAWLLSAIVVIALGSGVYFYQKRNAAAPGKQVTALPPARTGEPAAQPETKPEAGSKTQPEQHKAEQAKLVEPHFDVLRVEKDGSTVIAGTAAAASHVEIVSGDKVIATTEAGPTGDFAIVLDQPLSPGDHELSIKATGSDGKVVVSSETGIVHVPASKGDEVIAMVSKEGQASRVLQAPGGEKPATTETPATEAPATEAPATEAPATAKTQPTEKPAQEMAKAETPKAETPGEPAAATAKPESQATAEQAAPTAETPTANAPAGKAEEHPVLVKAVDVDAGKIFIAGTGEPGRNVNLYLDDKYLGTTKVGPEGGFLLEMKGDIVPGRHEVRADMLAPNSAEVTNRAVVPLIHEAPEAEVAGTEAPAAEKPSQMAAQTGQQAGGTKPQTMAETEQPASGTKSQTMAETEQPATETKPQTTAEANGQSGAQSAESAARPEAGTTAETGQPSSGQPPQMAETAKTAGEVTAAPAAKPVSGGQASGQSPATTATGEAATKPASPSERMGTETVQEVAKAGQPPTEEEVRPIHTGESVIIRRGDNLWTISRRMLGAGIKYTVIYEANRGQIRNPHWIFPGQVFDVPGAMQPMPRK